jgi:hypothetical protein
MKKILIAGASCILLFTSCRDIFAKRVRGNGNIITQTRSTGQFNSIDVSSSFDVYVKQDSSTTVKVEADENLQKYIEIENDGDLLRIKHKEGFNLRPSHHIKVYVSSSTFKKFDVSGSCNIYGEGKINFSDNVDFDLSGNCNVNMEVNAKKISTDISGSGSLNLKGEAKELYVSGSGSTDVKCMDLSTDNVSITISGSGDAEVNVRTKLDVKISGSGSVKYKGNATVNQDISGSGSIKKVE